MILIAGFVVVGCALIVEVLYQPPLWLHALLWLPLILATTLLPLRPLKGLMIALQYHHKAAEGRLDRGDAVTAARGLLIPAVVTLCGLAVLLGLGTWQLERKAWKEALIATLTSALSAAPVALPPPDAMGRPHGGEFRIHARAAARRFPKRATRWSTPAARRCATT